MLTYLKEETNYTTTTNGAVANKSTLNGVLDFFSRAGQMRNASDKEVISLFTKALSEDKELAMKALFYIRDVRGGQGERKTFRTIIKYLANNHPELIASNANLISYYGRYDDVYELFDTQLEYLAIEMIRYQMLADSQVESPSLLGKWLKSENASSYETKRLARKTREGLGITPRQYRKILSDLRRKIKIVESKMSSNEWTSIEYDKLPSKAGMVYRNAFLAHDPEGYSEFIESLKKGEKKVNSGTLFPYEIVSKYAGQSMVPNRNKSGYWNISYENTPENQEVLEAMWNSLPDYVNGSLQNALAVVDTSGSMRGLPADVALSLGLYLAERNKGAFHNHFITFSSTPELQKISGLTLGEKLANMSSADWGQSTNVEAVYRLILRTAVKNNLPQEELPSKLFIISDMQFDYMVEGGSDLTLHREMKKLYEANGYVLPEVVYWNVDSHSNFPVTMNEVGTALVSGCSPSIFKNLLAGKDMTPMTMMLEVLNSERYDLIVA